MKKRTTPPKAPLNSDSSQALSPETQAAAALNAPAAPPLKPLSPDRIELVFGWVDAGSCTEFVVSGLPPEAQLSAGTRDAATGQWHVPAVALDGLQMALPADHAGQFELTVTALAAAGTGVSRGFRVGEDGAVAWATDLAPPGVMVDRAPAAVTAEHPDGTGAARAAPADALAAHPPARAGSGQTGEGGRGVDGTGPDALPGIGSTGGGSTGTTGTGPTVRETGTTGTEVRVTVTGTTGTGTTGTTGTGTAGTGTGTTGAGTGTTGTGTTGTGTPGTGTPGTGTTGTGTTGTGTTGTAGIGTTGSTGTGTTGTGTTGTTGTGTTGTTGTGTAAVIGGLASATVAEDQQQTVGGKLTVTDPDAGEAAFVAQTQVHGAHGTFAVDADGTWSYQLDNGQAAVQALKDGDRLTDTLSVRTVDGTTQQITVTIDGRDDQARIAGTAVGAVQEDVQPHVGGQLTVTDADAGQAAFVAQAQAAGLHGSFTVDADGTWSYELDNGQAAVQALKDGDRLTDTLSVRTVDGTTQQITVTIDGRDDRAQIVGTAVGAVKEDDQPRASGKLTVTDPDAGQAEFVPMPAAQGAHGTFAITADGAWSYQLDNAQPAVQALKDGDQITDTITVSSKDGTTQQITITINGRDDQAQIAGTAVGTVKEDDQPQTSGRLTVTSPDAGQAEFVPMSAAHGAHGTFTVAPDGAWTYTLDNARPAVQALSAGEQLTDTIQVSSKDGTTQTLTVYVNGTDDTPVLRAVSQQATEDGATLHGQLVGTDADAGSILAYGCPQSVPGFALGVDGSYTFDPAHAAYQHLSAGEQLVLQIPVTVTDQTGLRDTQTLQITVTGTNDLPRMQMIPPAATFEGSPTLHGQLLAIDMDVHDTLSYRAPAPIAGFVLDADGSWTFDPADPAYDHLAFGQKQIITLPVEVTDSAGGVVASQIQITVTGTNDAPTLAVQPPRHVDEGAAAITGQLTATDPDTGDTLTYSVGQHIPGFTLNADGSYTFDPADPAYNQIPAGQQAVISVPVFVTDAHGLSDTQQVQITITGTNDVPIVGGIDRAMGAVAGAAGGRIQVQGQLTAIDLDAGESHFQAQLLAGTHGVLEIKSDGSWSYTADANSPALTQMPADGQLSEHFAVHTADGTSHDIDITLKGSNTPAIFAGIGNGMVSEDQTGRISHHLTVTDPNAGESAFHPVDRDAHYGHFTLSATGDWTYALDNGNAAVQGLVAGKTLTDSIVVGSIDGTPTVITVTIMGADDRALISGVHTGSVIEDNIGSGSTLAASGQLAVSDPDAGQDHFVAMQGIAGSNGFGSFSIDARGHWSYSADNSQAKVQALRDGETATDSVSFMAADGTRQTVTVTLHGTQDRAVIAGTATGAVTEDAGVSGGKLGIGGTLTVTDVDSGEAHFIAQTDAAGANGYGSFSIDAQGRWTYSADNTQTAVQSLEAGAQITDSITVSTADGTTHTLTVTLTGTNDAPVLQAQTQSVTEDGAALTGQMHATDVDTGDTLRFDLPNPVAGFTLDADGSYRFDPKDAAYQHIAAGQTEDVTVAVRVTDAAGATSTQNLVITVTGAQDGATISGTSTGSVSEDAAVVGGKLTTGGTLAVTDVDSGEAHFVAQTDVAGSNGYGSFSIDAHGHWTYSADNSQAAIQNLDTGQKLTDSITVHSADGTAQTITVTLNGQDDHVTIAGDVTGGVTEDSAAGGTFLGRMTTSGGSMAGGGDFGDHLIAGQYGSFDVRANGRWIYTLDNTKAAVQGLAAGETAQDKITVTTRDGATQELVVTVTGTHDLPTITAHGAAQDHSITGVTQVLHPTGAADLSAFATQDAGMPAGTRLLALYAPGSDANVLDGIPVDQRPTIGSNYNPVANVHGYQFLSTNGWFGANVHVAGYDFAPQPPEQRNTWDGGVAVFSDGTVVQVVKVCNGNGTGEKDYIYFAKYLGINPNAGGSVVTGEAAAGATVEVYAGSQRLGSATADANGHWELGVARLPDGTQSLHTVINGQAQPEHVFGINGATATEHPGGLLLGSLQEDAATDHLTGTLDVTDIDTTDNPQFTVQGGTAGHFGTFAIDAQGHWTYTLDNSKAETNALTAGESHTETFTVEVTTRTGEHVSRDVTVTVTGANDGATVTATDAAHAADLGTLAEDTAHTYTQAELLRLVGAADADTGDTLSISAVTIDAQYGSFAKQPNGDWTFTPAANAHHDDIPLTLTVSDGHGTTQAHGTLDVTPVTDAATVTLTMTAEQEIIGTGTGATGGRILVDSLHAGQQLSEATFEFTVVGQAAGSGSGSRGPVILNFGDASNNNMLSLWNPADMKIGGAGDAATGINLADGQSHRITLTWTSASGDLKVYDNGQLVTTVHNYHQGGTLPADGFLVLGQKWNHPGDTTNPGWIADEHYDGSIFNAAVAGKALAPDQVATAPLASILDSQSGLIIDVRSVGGQLTDATGTHSLSQQGGLTHTSGQVDLSLAPPPPGSLLHLNIGVTAPTDHDDHVTHHSLTGLPAGTVLSDGTHHVTASGAPISLDGWNLGQITAQLPNDKVNFRIVVDVETTGPDGTTAHGTAQSAVVMDPTQPVPDAVIAGDDTGSGDEDAAAITGILTVTDADASQTHFTAQTDTDGHYGKFSVGADGRWTYTPDDRADALAEGASAQEHFTVRSADGTTHQVSIALTGTNDAPSVTATASAAADLGAVQIGATLTFTESTLLQLVGGSDAEGDSLHVTAIDVDAAVGSFAKDAISGNWIFTPATGQAVADAAIRITLNDGQADTRAAATLDIVPPLAITGIDHDTGKVGDFVTSDATQVLSGTGTPGDTIEIFDGIGTLGTTTVGTDGHWSLDLTGHPLRDGNHDLMAAGKNPDGTDGAAQQMLVIDTGQPTLTIDPLSRDDVLDASDKGQPLTIEGAATHLADGSTVAITLAGNHYSATVSQGHWQVQVPATDVDALRDQNLLVEAHAETLAGNAADAQRHVIVSASPDTMQASATVQEDVTLTAGGQIFGGAASGSVDTPTQLQGNYGTLTIDADGQFHYALDNAQAAVQQLSPGETLHDTFLVPVTKADGSQLMAQVGMTIEGSNDAPSITGALETERTLASGSMTGISTTGKVVIADPDLHDALSVTINGQAFDLTSAHGQHFDTAIGQLSMSPDGTWTYAIDKTGPARDAMTATLHGGGSQAEHFLVVVTDSHGESRQADIVITILGDAANPTLRGTLRAAVVEDVTPAADGVLNVVDQHGVRMRGITGWAVDPADDGSYGQFSVDSSGRWHYTLDNADARVQALAGGATLVDHATITATDAQGNPISRTIEVDITGTNDAPVISGDRVQNLAADATAAVSGKLAGSDVDTGETVSFTAETLHGQYGDLAIDASGQWHYTVNKGASATQALNPGQSAADEFTVTATGSDGTTVQQKITVNVEGREDAPVIAGTHTGAVSEDDATKHTATGTLTATDADTGDVPTFTAQTDHAGTYGSFSVDASGQWTYTLDDSKAQTLAAGQQRTDTFTVEAHTADGETVQQQVTVTVTGSNDAPVLQAQTQSVTEDGSLLRGQMQAADTDAGDTLKFTTASTAGGFTLNADGSYSFDPSHADYQNLAVGETRDVVIHITATDGAGATSVRDLTITVTGTNDAPVIGAATTASASALTVAAGHQMTLDDHPLATIGQSWVANGDSALGSILQEIDGGSTIGALFLSRDPQHVWPAKFVITEADLVFTKTDGVPPLVTLPGTPAGGTSQVTLGDLQGYLKQGYTLHFSFAEGTNPGFRLNDVADASQHVLTFTNGNVVDGDNYLHRYEAFDFQGGALTLQAAAPGAGGGGAALQEGEVQEDLAESVSGTLTAHDVDTGDTLHFAVQGDTHGQYGDLTLDAATGAWSYHLHQGAQALHGGAIEHETFTIVVRDDHGGETSQDVTLTIKGTEDNVPTITGTTTGRVTEDGTVTASGTLHATDAEGDAFRFAPHDATAPLHGQYGTLTIDADGQWTYTVDNSNAAVNRLNGAADSFLTDTIAVATESGAVEHISVRIQGHDDAPVVTSVNLGEFGNYLGAQDYRGHVAVSDPDSTVTVTLDTTTLGTDHVAGLTLNPDGSFAFNPRDPAYQHLNVAERMSVDVPVLVSDGVNPATAHTLHFVVVGNDQAPTISGFTQSESLTTSGVYHFTVSDFGYHDRETALLDHVTITAMPTAQQGDILLDGQRVLPGTDISRADIPRLEFHPAAGFTGEATFSYTVHDGTHASLTTAVGHIQVGAPATIAGADTGSGDEDAAGISGILTITAADAAQQHFIAQTDADGHYGKFSIGTDGHWTYTPDDRADALTDGQTQQEVFTVRAADGTTHQVTVTLTGTNDAPTVSATPAVLDATAEDTAHTYTEAELLKLVGASDAEGDTLSISSVAVDPQYGTFAKQPDGTWRFTPAANVSHDDVPVTLTVSDGHGTSVAQGTLDITAAPGAGAGSYLIPAGDMNTLLGISGAGHIDTITGNAGDTFVQQPNGDWLYTPAPGTSPDSLSITAAVTGSHTFRDPMTTRIITMDGGTARGMLDLTQYAQQPGQPSSQGSDTFSGTDSATVTEDQNLDHGQYLVAQGDIDATDANGQPVFFMPIPLGATGSGGYGQFQVGADGVWHYQASNANPAIQALNQGEHLTDSLEVTARDGSKHTITVTIEGTNEGPLASHDQPLDGSNPATDFVVTLGAPPPPPPGEQFDVVQATLDEDGQVHGVLAGMGAAGTGDPPPPPPPPPTDAESDAPAPPPDADPVDLGATPPPPPPPPLAGDAGRTVTPVVVLGNYGLFAIDGSGQWTYTPDDRADALSEGEAAQDVFTVTLADGTKHEMVMTLTGSDDAPVLAPPLPPPAEQVLAPELADAPPPAETVQVELVAPPLAEVAAAPPPVQQLTPELAPPAPAPAEQTPVAGAQGQVSGGSTSVHGHHGLALGHGDSQTHGLALGHEAGHGSGQGQDDGTPDLPVDAPVDLVTLGLDTGGLPPPPPPAPVDATLQDDLLLADAPPDSGIEAIAANDTPVLDHAQALDDVVAGLNAPDAVTPYLELVGADTVAGTQGNVSVSAGAQTCLDALGLDPSGGAPAPTSWDGDHAPVLADADPFAVPDAAQDSTPAGLDVHHVPQLPEDTVLLPEEQQHA
jgi:VCBS repeat-containing protein